MSEPSHEIYRYNLVKSSCRNQAMRYTGITLTLRFYKVIPVYLMAWFRHEDFARLYRYISWLGSDTKILQGYTGISHDLVPTRRFYKVIPIYLMAWFRHEAFTRLNRYISWQTSHEIYRYNLVKSSYRNQAMRYTGITLQNLRVGTKPWDIPV
jgi:hypothetical protein